MATTNLRDTYERIEMKVSDICDINKSNVNFTKDQLVEYLDTGSLTEGVIDSLAKVRYGDAPSRAQRAVEKDTILYSTVRPNLKHYGIVAEYNPNIVVSTGFTTIDVKENKKEEIDAHFLYYLMTQQWVTKHLHTIAQSSVSSYPSISPSDIGNLEFEFPFIATQRRIASVLSNIDKKIALNRQINQNLEALAKQLYDYWFVQFDFPDENGKPYKSSGGAMVYNEQLKREIPKGWEVKTINDLAEVFNGATPSTSDSLNYGGDIIWITPKDLSNQQSKFIIQGERNITDKGYGSCSTHLLPVDSILMSSRAPIGLFTIAKTELCTNQGFKSFVPKDKLLNSYLYYYLLQYKKQIERLGTGTTFKEVSRDDMLKFLVLTPNTNILHLFEEKAKAIGDEQLTIQNENSSLIKQRDELLPLLMNGQVNFDLSAC